MCCVDRGHNILGTIKVGVAERSWSVCRQTQ